MGRSLEEIRADYKFHAAEVGHRARLLKRLAEEARVHEAKMDAFAVEEAEALSKVQTIAVATAPVLEEQPKIEVGA